MRKLCGNFLGTGAILNLAIGFIPDRVLVRNLTSTVLAEIEWNRFMVEAASVGGLKRLKIADNGATGNANVAKLAYGTGISRYYGGSQITAQDTSILVFDPAGDKRNTGTMGPITTWTLQNATNRTGKLNAGVNTTDVGVGSRITVGDPLAVDGKKTATVIAITNDGDADNEITLDYALPSGPVLALTGKTTLVAATPTVNNPLVAIPNGFTLAADSDVNVSGNNLYFEAEKLF